MPYCQICGTEYFEGRMFCRKCGATLPRPERAPDQPDATGVDPGVPAPEESSAEAWRSIARPIEGQRVSWLTRNALLVVVAVVFVVVVAVAAVLLSKKSLPADFYRGDGFALRPPAGWRIDTSGTLGTKAFFFGPRAAGFSANMNDVKAPAGGLSLTDLVARTRVSYPQVFTAFRLVEDRPIRVQGNDAYILGGTYTQGVFTLRERQLFEIQNGVEYVVTATDSADDWPVQDATFESSLETFRPT